MNISGDNPNFPLLFIGQFMGMPPSATLYLNNCLLGVLMQEH